MEMQATTKCHDESLQDTTNEALAGIKDYIKSAKDFRSKCRLRGEVKPNEEAVFKNRSIIFSIEYTQHWMGELEKEFIKDVTDVDRDQLLEWRTKISSYNAKMEKIAESYKEILKTPINSADILMDIKRIGENYVKLETLKQMFKDKLHKEISVRELDKDVKFNKHQLNIQLEKFTGYDASSDVYTFRSNFEKVHLDSTPKRLLPDLLKNNYFDEPAKNLVTSLDNIDEIWDRLQSAYGDTNIMIRKKLQSLLKIDLTRTRDSERTIAGLSKLTNALHDIIKLAKTDNIEERLYFGDGLTKVYQLIGDNRVTHSCQVFMTMISARSRYGKDCFCSWKRELNWCNRKL